MEINSFSKELGRQNSQIQKLRESSTRLKEELTDFSFAPSFLFRVTSAACKILSRGRVNLHARTLSDYKSRIAKLKQEIAGAKRQLMTSKLAHSKLLIRYLDAQTKQIRRGKSPDLQPLPGRITWALTRLKERSFLPPERLPAFMQALSYYQLHRDTHRVFMHSTPMAMAIVNMVFKQLLSKLDKEPHRHNFKVMRHPSQTKNKNRSANEWKSWMKERREHPNGGYWTDRNYMSELVSVSATPTSTQNGESALDWFKRNGSLKPDFALKQLRPVLDSYGQLKTAKKESFLKAIAAMLQGKRISTARALLTFCIPKAITHKVGYRSHPFGFTCTCRGMQNDETTLDNLQKKEHSKCRAEGTQYRLVTKELFREGIRIFSSYHLTRQEITAIKQRVALAVKELIS